jgi:hypothetical protein
MARGVYTGVFQRVAVTAPQDLFMLLTSSAVPIEVLSIRISQSSDFGDAQDELLPVRFRTGMTTNGSGGSAPTPTKTAQGDAAATATLRVNDTTASSGGTILELWEDCFNVRGGFVYMPLPDERFLTGVSARFAVNLPTAPADSITMSGTITWKEYV